MSAEDYVAMLVLSLGVVGQTMWITHLEKRVAKLEELMAMGRRKREPIAPAAPLWGTPSDQGRIDGNRITDLTSYQQANRCKSVEQKNT